MNKFLRLIFRQHKMGNLYGNFMQIAQQLGLVSNAISLVLLIVTTSMLLQGIGLHIQVWQLGLLVACLLCIAGVVVFTLGLPSYFGAFNKQFYKHNNPMRRDIEKIMEKLGIQKEENED